MVRPWCVRLGEPLQGLWLLSQVDEKPLEGFQQRGDMSACGFLKITLALV